MTAVRRRGPQGQQWHGWRGKILNPPTIEPEVGPPVTATERAKVRANTRMAIKRWSKRLARSQGRIAKPNTGDLARWAAMRGEIERLQKLLEELERNRA
jgi:hypothetical protein